jgi:hypothetical protein
MHDLLDLGSTHAHWNSRRSGTCFARLMVILVFAISLAGCWSRQKILTLTLYEGDRPFSNRKIHIVPVVDNAVYIWYLGTTADTDENGRATFTIRKGREFTKYTLLCETPNAFYYLGNEGKSLTVQCEASASGVNLGKFTFDSFWATSGGPLGRYPDSVPK